MSEQSTEAELQQLRDQVQQLQAQLNEQKADSNSTSEKSTSDSIADTTSRCTDAQSQFFRGVTLAAMEGLRLTANVVSAFTGEVMDKNQPKEGESRSARELIQDLPGNIASGISKAIDEAIDIPGKSAERFSNSYRQGAKD